MKQLPQKPNQIVVKDRQTLADAYLDFYLRLVRQQRTIEKLKRDCGVR